MNCLWCTYCSLHVFYIIDGNILPILFTPNAIFFWNYKNFSLQAGHLQWNLSRIKAIFHIVTRDVRYSYDVVLLHTCKICYAMMSSLWNWARWDAFTSLLTKQTGYRNLNKVQIFLCWRKLQSREFLCNKQQYNSLS